MDKEKWVFCPICKSKTRIRIMENTSIENLPGYCPKCKNRFILNVEHGYKVTTK